MDLSVVQEDETVQLSLHQIGLKNVFKMASMMDLNPEVTLVGIVPKDYQDYNIGLSEEVEKAIPLAIETVLKEIET
jgi:hydrogenase maturation protease